MDLVKVFYGVLFGILGQLFSFIQLQGAIKYNWHSKYMWLILLSSVPTSWVFIKSVTFLVQGFGGEIWPSRLIGFAIGICVFTSLSMILFKEEFTLKTIISILLAFAILLVQLLMK